MGYTHYWNRPVVIVPETYAHIVRDVQKLVEACQEVGIALAGWDGTGDPEIGPRTIAFNGVEQCHHANQDLGIAWPADDATGVQSDRDTVGTWFAGALLATRQCGGDCSHETFAFNQNESDDPSDFRFCKTAYKPYDLAVTAALIVIKHYVPAVSVRSDGGSSQWDDARMLCTMVLGYGRDFKFDRRAAHFFR